MLRSDESPDAAPVDWGQVRQGFRRLVGALAGQADALLVDDLVQEACVRYLRARRREPVREPEAMMTTLARRTWYDHLRRRTRARERFTPLSEDHERVAASSPARDPSLGDPAERLTLVVQEVFLARGAHECLQLLQAFLAAGGWQNMAERQQVGYAALRKRWSRCLAVARRALSDDADLSLWID